MKSQHLKRCLAMLLSLALIITAMPVQAFATSEVTAEPEAENNIQTTSDVNTYTITFYADKEQTVVLQEVTVEEGEIPEPAQPVKAPDEYYRYEFTGWNRPLNPAYLDESYYANWKYIEQFSVLFLDWDGNEVFDKPMRVDKGTDLTQYEEVPMDLKRESDEEYSYEFIGWSPELSTSVTKDLTYTAQYKATEIIYYIDLTFDTAANGTYTVDGNAVTEKTLFEQTTTKTDYVLKATPAPGYEFFGWYAGSKYLTGDAEYTFRASKDVTTEPAITVTPKFVKTGTAKFQVNGTMQDGLENAIAAAQEETSDGVMVLMNDTTFNEGTYHIPEGVTLVIPHDEKAEVYRKKPGVADEDWVQPTAYRTLTLEKDAKLIVDGELSVTAIHVPGSGGRANGGSPHKAYGHIATEAGSEITINNGGSLYAYGYITGEGSVTAQKGATVYEYFQIMDFRGGSATTTMVTTGVEDGYAVLPLSQYYVQNIEVPLTIEAGATEYCYTSLKMSGNIIGAAVGFIGEGKDMMFKLKSGTVTKYYDGTKDRLIAEVNGDLNIAPIVISGGGNTVNSEQFVLPINSNISIYVNSGSINMTQDVALIPGSELVIAKGATCTLNEDCSVYVYDGDTWGKFCATGPTVPFRALTFAPGRTYTRTDADLKDAVVCVDGTLDATKGYLYTTKGGANVFSTDAGKIVLRKGTEEVTHQFEYTGPPAADERHYGIYHEIEIDPAVLKNGNGSVVTQDLYEDRGIINYSYKNGEWVIEGHIIVIDDGYAPSCNTPGLSESMHCNFEDCPEHTQPAKEIPPTGHSWVTIPAKKPTYTSVGWAEHQECSVCHMKEEGYKDNIEIPKLESDGIVTYDEFLTSLATLEEWAEEYVNSNPGKDAAGLIIKYIRTGVERYNSGSWGIMAGYEDTAFAEFVAAKEDAYNSAAAAEGKDLVKVSGLKDLHNFELPNGDMADFGHMFGTMDITYHNNFGVNHADVGGWAGDIVDLLCLADQYGVGDAKTTNEMVEYIKEHYFLKETEEVEKEYGEEAREGSFSQIDVYGDLDAYALMRNLEKADYEAGTLTELLEAYFTADLTDEQRAFNILENRFEDKSLRIDLRDEVYTEVVSNKVVKTLEATREFDHADLTDLRKASCYAFADYICELAGDYVAELDNPYLSVFSSTFSTLAPGITQKTYQAKTADGKQSDYYIATADVTRDDVHVFTNYNNNDVEAALNGKWGMQRVIDQANAAQANYSDPNSEKYIENFNVIASINGGGYDMSNGRPSGLFVMEGKEIMSPDNHEFFGILTDGTAIMAGKAEYEKLKAEGKVKEAIGAFGTLLVKDGRINIQASSDYFSSRASRTAIGITKTGKVVFMVMDGRQGEYSCGGSMEEIAQVMLDAGCEHAMNLDGGGSSTYVARLEGADELSVVNNPSDGVSRSVSTSLFVASTAPNSNEFDHAVVESNYNYMTVNSSVQLTASGVSATNNAVDLPEGTYWMVEDDSYGEITKDGVFTAKAEGEVNVKLMLDGNEVGSKTIYVVTPDNLYFTRPSVNAVYGQTIEIPVNAVYKNKDVAINGDDITFTLSDETVGKIDGLSFIINENIKTKNVQISAKLTGNDSVSALFTVYLYNQGEASFDFEQATGGNRQFAWDRKVSNAVTDDNSLYTVVNAKDKMEATYTFAIDMSHIDIPERLEDLTYMLPGADMEGASAWTFLCQLAERMSDQTEVRATVEFDKDVDVDYSGLTLVNDYFMMTDKSFDKETNTLTVILKWKKQDKPIEVALANPICILSGIKTTPGAGAEWNNREQLDIVNKGSIDYTVYMRANGLYTFCQNAENREIYGLQPYVHPLIDTEKGGYFSSTYTTFEENYILDKSIKNGWEGAKDADGNSGMRYYDNGVMYTGIRAVDGKYYDFGKNGICYGQKVYTGEMTENGKEYYVFSGEIFKKGCSVWTDRDDGWFRVGENDWRFYDPETGAREEVTTSTIEGTCIRDTVYTFTSESGQVKTVRRDDAGGHEYVEQENGEFVCSVCNWQRVKMEDVEVTLGFNTATYAGNYKRPSVTAVNPLTGETLTREDPVADYKIKWANSKEVGQASVTLNAYRHGHYVNLNDWRGNYSDSKVVYFTILPDAPKDAKAVYNDGTVKLTWTAAQVEETDTADNQTSYIIYKSVNGGDWKKVGTTSKTSYTVTKDMKNDDTIKFRIKTLKAGADGTVYESSKYANASMTYKTPKIAATNNASSGKVYVSWEKVSSAKKYEIYRATSKSGKYTKVYTTSKTIYKDTKAVAGKTYYYKVRAVTNSGKTKFSNIVYRMCDLSRPIVTASNVASSGKIKLTWKKVSGAKKYVVYRATSQDGKYTKMFTTTKTSYVNSNAKAGKTYYYKVKALASKSSANSAYSKLDSRTCDLARPVVTIKSPAKKQVKLTWKKVSGAKQYVIYRSTSKNGTYKKLYTTTKLSYVNKSLKSGKTYYYKVKALASKSAANSAYSLKKSIKVK